MIKIWILTCYVYNTEFRRMCNHRSIEHLHNSVKLRIQRQR